MTRKQKKNRNRILLSALLLMLAFVADRLLEGKISTPLCLLLYLPAYFAVGYDVLWRAMRNIIRGRVFDENFLMALATVGAMAIGFLPSCEPEFAEAVFVMLFYQVGELFQSVAVGKSRRSIAALMDIRPDSARVLRGGEEIEVSPEEVAVGEEILVRPGERIPLDGVILEGFSDLNALALTGESAPFAVGVGESISGGATNLTGVLRIRAARVYGDSAVARILSLMENAAAKKSKSERFITRFAGYYTPVVVIAALFLAFLPPLFGGNFGASFPLWFARALTFLVVSCPCALVISVPLSFFGGLGGAAKRGVLVKGASGLETLAAVDTVVFDKNGTLTTGRFAVATAVPVGDYDADELLTLAAVAEKDSNHPIAQAVAAAGHVDRKAENVREVPGKGVICEIDGHPVAVGNLRLMAEIGLDPVPSSEAGTALYVAQDRRYLGYIVITDTLRPGMRDVMDQLKGTGVRRLAMLTGDRAPVASAVADELGLTHWRAELLPADKVAGLEAFFEDAAGRIAFVGDGINDAPVLMRADVGIAMGGLGSDAAIEAADVVLMEDDPAKIPVAIRHARRTLAIVRQNIVLALSVKGAVLVGSALGLFGALQMPLAIFADVGVAVLAILNAMRKLK